MPDSYHVSFVALYLATCLYEVSYGRQFTAGTSYMLACQARDQIRDFATRERANLLTDATLKLAMRAAYAPRKDA